MSIIVLPCALVAAVIFVYLRRMSRDVTFPPYISVSFNEHKESPVSIGKETGRLSLSTSHKLLLTAVVLFFNGIFFLYLLGASYATDSSNINMFVAIDFLFLYAYITAVRKRIVIFENGLEYRSAIMTQRYYFDDMEALWPDFQSNSAWFAGVIYVLELRSGKKLRFTLYRMERFAGFLRYKENPYISGYRFILHPRRPKDF